MNHRVDLDIHGLTASVLTPDDAVKADLEHDFHYFLGSPPCRGEPSSFQMRHHAARNPPEDWRPLLRLGSARFYRAPRRERRLRFFDRAWIDYRPLAGRCDVYCDESAKAYEACYLALMAFLGEGLGLRGLHRIHGLGLALGDGAALVLAPSGAGKSALAMRLLSMPGVAIMSDDTPLVGASGEVRALPLRIGLRQRPAVPERFVRAFRRSDHAEKFVVSCEYFKDKVRGAAAARWIVLAVRGAGPARLERAGRASLLWPLLKWLVLGYETPQIWQLFLRLSPPDLYSRAKILFSRLLVACGLLRRCQAFFLYLSDDVEQSCAALASLPRASA